MNRNRWSFILGRAFFGVMVFLIATSTVAGQGGTGRETPRKSTPSRPIPRAFRPTNPNIEMVLIRGGTFLMGSPESEGDRNNDEGPLHSVTVQSFFMGKYEVTQAQWHAVMGNNPSFFPGCARCPVEKVSWLDAKEFVRRLNEMQSGYSYRLPSEAEWEYASRAGTTTPFAFGSSLSPSQAAFRLEKPVSVGGYQPNNWGLYDMHGNVTEWCEDWYHGDYNAAPTDGIAWLSGGEQKQRVVRGGNWGNSSVRFLRSANRMDVYRYGPGFGGNWIGFRLAASGR